jgi:hypothetical protein
MSTSAANISDAAAASPRSRRGVGAVFAFFLCAYWLTSAGYEASEAVFHYDVARNIVRNGELGFDRLRWGIFMEAPNGRTYGGHEFGNALLLIPTAAGNMLVGHYVDRVAPELTASAELFPLSFQAGLYTALMIAIVFAILRGEFGLTARSAFGACLALGFCTYVWNYSRMAFDGVLCGLLVVAAFWALLRYRATRRDRYLFAAFALLGYGVDTRLSVVVFLAGAAAFVVASCPGGRVRQLLIAGCALLPFAIWQFWYNHLRTGNALTSPMQLPRFVSLDGNLGVGLLGLLVSPGKGILVYAPLVAAAAIAFPRLWRRDRAVALFIGMSTVLWFLLHGKLHSWHGAWGWGPRHMITIVPLVCLPALIEWNALWARRGMRVFLGLALFAGFTVAGSAVICSFTARLSLAEVEHRADEATFIWGGSGHPWNSTQALDVMSGAVRNMQVLTGAAEPQAFPNASTLFNRAANGFDLWWYILPGAGVPPHIIVEVCAVLILVMVWSAGRLLVRPEA